MCTFSAEQVTQKTKITVVGPTSVKNPKPLGEGRPPSAEVENEKPIVEEVKYASLGGLEQQIKEIKEIVRFALLQPELLAEYAYFDFLMHFDGQITILEEP